MNVLRPGHIQIRVLCLDEALLHYRDLLGLIEVYRESDKVYLKGWTEVESYSVILREDESPGLDFVGFKVASPDCLKSVFDVLSDLGMPVEKFSPNELRDCGERVSFVAPSGHRFEFYAEKKITGKWGIASENPDPWPIGLSGIGVLRFDHCLLYGVNLKETLLVLEKLGFYLTEELVSEDGERIAQFLSLGYKAHDIAFIKHDEPGKFHHASFWVESWQDILKASDLISMTNTSLDIGPTRHGLTHGNTVYFFDPSGNRNEVFTGGDYSYPDNPVVTWTESEIGKAVFYFEKSINERFMGALT
jgi:catechol 2,3-dioxygenase